MPLIDIVFLLLIFFLITTSFSQNQDTQLTVKLPQGVSGKDIGQGDRVILVVTDNGEVAFEGNVDVKGDSLDARLKYLKENHPDAKVMLRGDTAASHGRVVEILDTAKSMGFPEVNMIIRKKKN